MCYTLIFNLKATFRCNNPCSTGEDGDPLLLVGNQDEIGIEFDVSNPHPAEDAHQAKLFILLPDFLIYVGFLEQSAMVKKYLVICLYYNFIIFVNKYLFF